MSYPNDSSGSYGAQPPSPWTGIDALLNAFQAAESQQQTNQTHSGSPNGLGTASTAPPVPTTSQVLDQAAVQRILSNPDLLSAVVSMLSPPTAPSSSAPQETVHTRSGRPVRPPALLQEDQLLAQIQEIWGGLDLSMLSNIDPSGNAQASSSTNFNLASQLSNISGGAQTFAPAAGQMDVVGDNDWWWPMQEEGEEDDPSYVPPDTTTPSNGGGFVFSPAGEGDFLTSLGLNANGRADGAPQGTTSALYASPAAASLMELASSLSPNPHSPAFNAAAPHGQPSLSIPAGSSSAPTPAPASTQSAPSTLSDGRSLRARKKVRMEEPVASASTAKGKKKTSSTAAAPAPAAVAPRSAGGTSIGSDSEGEGTVAGGPETEDVDGNGTKKSRRPVLTKEESAARRRARNKASALESRRKAKAYTSELEVEVTSLKARIVNLEKQLSETKAELTAVSNRKPSFYPDAKVYYNTPNIYDPAAAVPGSVPPQHPFAQLPPTPVKRKRGRPRKIKVDDKDDKKVPEAGSSNGPETMADAAVSLPTPIAPSTVLEEDEEEEAQFTEDDEGSGNDQAGEDDEADDDSEDPDFQEVPVPQLFLSKPVNSSPSSQTTVKRSGPTPSTVPGSTPPSSAIDLATSEMSSSSDEDDPSSDFEKDSDFDPTEDLYLPIRDVPFPNPPPDSPARPVAGGGIAVQVSPARAALGAAVGQAAGGAGINNGEVVDLLKQLLAKMGGTGA